LDGIHRFGQGEDVGQEAFMSLQVLQKGSEQVWLGDGTKCKLLLAKNKINIYFSLIVRFQINLSNATIHFIVMHGELQPT